MAEAHKCDVVNCGVIAEGSPAGRFNIDGASKAMCQKHTDALIESYFPDLKRKDPEPLPEETDEEVKV